MTLALVILGPPGGGKDRLACDLAETLSVPLVSAGEISRALADNAIVGLSEHDEIPELALREEVCVQIEGACASNGVVVIEGFPRDLPQLCVLESLPGLQTSYVVVSSSLTDCLKELAKKPNYHPDAAALRLQMWFDYTQPMMKYLGALLVEGIDSDIAMARVLKVHARKLAKTQ